MLRRASLKMQPPVQACSAAGVRPFMFRRYCRRCRPSSSSTTTEACPIVAAASRLVLRHDECRPARDIFAASTTADDGEQSETGTNHNASILTVE